MSPRRRRVRYGAPIAVAVLGIVWAAVDTDRVGNTVGTVLIAVGLIAFMTLVGRDIGMGQSTGRVPRVDVHERPSADAGERPSADAGERPSADAGERPSAGAGERPSGRPDAADASNGRSLDGARRLQRDGSPPSSPS